MKAADEIKNFVGREKELAILEKSWQKVISGKDPMFVLIEGDFGSGKTALVNKFTNTQAKKSVLVATAQCALESQDNGLVPFVHLIESIGKQTQKIQTTITGMISTFSEIAPAWIDVFTAGAATNIADATSKTLKAGASMISGTKITLDNVFVQFTNFLLHITKKSPTIIFIDDIHWADTSSLSLIFHLFRYLKERPVMFIFTYRPVEGLETGTNTKTLREIRANLIRYGAIELNITEGLNIDEYVGVRYQHNEFSKKLIENIREQSDGHALYISQLFTWWEETEIIKQEKNIWVVKNDVDLFIPLSVSEVLEERIQIMEKSLREALLIASVQGDDFTAQIISSLNNTIDDYETYNLLDRLEKRYKLVKEDHKEELGTTTLDFYRFLHRFFREHVYKNLNSGQRRLLHKKVGEYLETLYKGNLLQVSGQLARHFYEAKDHQKAVAFSIMASAHEGTRFSWNECQEWCNFGLHIIELDPKLKKGKKHYQLLRQIGIANCRLGKWDTAHKYLLQALEMAPDIDIESREQIELNTQLVEVAENENNLKLASKYANDAKSILSSIEVPSSDLVFITELAIAIVKIWEGKNKEAAYLLKKAIDKVSHSSKSKELHQKTAIAYNYLATALSNLDEFEEATKAFKQMIAIAQEIGDKSLESLGLTTLIEDEIYRGKTTEYLELINKAIYLAQTVGDRETESYALATRGHLYVYAKKFKPAIDSLTVSLKICKEIQTEWNLALIYSDLAIAHLKLSEFQIADELSATAVDFGRKSYKYLLGISLDARGQVNAAFGRWKQANVNFQEAIEVFEETEDLHLASRVRLHFVDALISQNKHNEASKILDKATSYLNNKKINFDLDIAKSLRKRLNNI